MKMRVLLISSLLVLSACKTPGPVITDEVSDSGIDFSLVSMPGNSRISVQIGWPSNWAFVEENNMAVPHIGSQLILAGGAQGFPAGEVVERFSDMQSEGHLGPTPEFLFGTLHYSPEHQSETLEMANAHLKGPLLDEKWFQRIRNDFDQGIKETRSQPISAGFETLRWLAFGDQPIRAALSLDTPNAIEEATASDVAQWLDTSITRNQASVVIAGDLDASEAGAAIDALFEGLPQGERIRGLEATMQIIPSRVLLHTPDTDVSNLTFIAPLPVALNASEFEDVLLTNELGTGSESVLFKAVRSELKASYHFGAFLTAFTQKHRVLILSGQVETAKLAEAETLIRKEYTKFLSDGFQSDLARAKKPIESNLKELVKDTGSMAFTVLMAKLNNQDNSRALSLEKELDSISVDSINARLKSAFPAADDFLVIATSPDAEALADACVITAPKQALDC